MTENIDHYPSKWSSKPLGMISSLRSKTGYPEEELLSVYLDRGVVRFSDVDEKRTNVTSTDLSGYQLVEAGDFVLNNQQAWRGSVGVSFYRGIVSPAYLVLGLSDELYPSFANYLFRDHNMVGHFLICSKGVGTIQRNLYWPQVKRIPVAYPSLSEQKAIAKFLDQRTTQIDKAIRVKEEQITLLKERKHIIIQTAVTRGLDPDAPMRESGMEWIGEIPTHWEIQRFKNLFTQSRLPPRSNDGVVTAYRDGQVTLRSNRRLDGYTEAILEGGYQGIRVGQLVLNSMDAFEGAIGVSDSEGKCTPEYVICDPISDGSVPEYFALLLREMSLSRYLRVISNAVRQRAIRIRFNNLAPQQLIVPPIEEQKAIIDFVAQIGEQHNAASALLAQQITKLKEYKTTLINSAVTGKIKVPGVMEPHGKEEALA